MKILITGTHFTPAQAVTAELNIKYPQAEIIYLGRKYTREGDKTLSPESQILPNLGVKFVHLTAGRLQRSFTIYTIPSLLKIPIGFIQSFYLLVKYQPDVILSFGGYLAVPVVIAGWLLSIPIMIHEQTLVPGLANKISALFADKIAVSFENGNFPKSKTILTGNPLRPEIINFNKNEVGDDIKAIVKRADNKKLPIVLIMGGNQGSHIINQTVQNSLSGLTKFCSLIHQTGESKFQDFENLVEIQNKSDWRDLYLPRKWLNASEVGFLLRTVDLAITRAGINTLMELDHFKIPMIIIPIEDHFEQQSNARFFSKNGVADVLQQKNLNKNNLIDHCREFFKKTGQGVTKNKFTDNKFSENSAKRLALETVILLSKSV